jgi:hypothetical protein
MRADRILDRYAARRGIVKRARVVASGGQLVTAMHDALEERRNSAREGL